ncbi:uncharacterized protein LOC111048889 [Nilaparvata lugens]|uniref:uncharacterized protein LOC111048889 n=1 Tax=Nilaparvata lugens TaxID=108931 RepID=UPI00193E9A5F|nr:uncharacterized protein LOC111048889 [Nilaparvata lugens]
MTINRRIRLRIMSCILWMILFFTEVCQAGPFAILKPLRQTRETNLFNFMRLMVIRLIYGVAKMMGFEEGISEFANGALVPPGVEDNDDYGFGFGERDDDYNDDYDDYK